MRYFTCGSCCCSCSNLGSLDGIPLVIDSYKQVDVADRERERDVEVEVERGRDSEDVDPTTTIFRLDICLC